MATPDTALPEVPFQSFHYFRDGSVEQLDNNITPLEAAAMRTCLALGDQALSAGNPPIGAVLIDYDTGRTWGAQTIDKTEPDLVGHAELRAYHEAKTIVGKDLARCALVTTAQPCNTCTSPYAEGKIGEIVYAAPRAAIYEVSGLMRPRRINMHDLLEDGDTDTVVTQGYLATNALAGFASWGRMRLAGRVNL